jgi:hypothetical protein
MKKVALLLLLVAVLLAACTYPSGAVPQQEPIQPIQCTNFDHGSLWRCVDAEAGVVCWMIYGAGLDCMPLEDTDLEGYRE